MGLKFDIKKIEDLPGGPGKESICQCRGHGFDPYMPQLLKLRQPRGPMLCNKRNHRNKKPMQ